MKRQRGEATIVFAIILFVGMTLYTLADNTDTNRKANEAQQVQIEQLEAENAELKADH